MFLYVFIVIILFYPPVFNELDMIELLEFAEEIFHEDTNPDGFGLLCGQGIFHLSTPSLTAYRNPRNRPLHVLARLLRLYVYGDSSFVFFLTPSSISKLLMSRI